MKPMKLGLCLALALSFCTVTSISAMAEDRSVDAAGNVMLNKYSPYQDVTYRAEDLTVEDSRICIHGDIGALDVHYTVGLEKSVQPVENQLPMVESREVSFWECQGDVLER